MAIVEIKTLLIVAALALISLGIGYFIYLKTRPKKQTWRARVFQLGDGITEVVRDKGGNIISELKLKQLLPYCKDFIEKIEKEGQDIYHLVGLNKTVGTVTNNVVNNWSKDNKEVDVLIDQENCVLLKGGWDEKTGTHIFRPMPSSRINLIKTEIITRKARLEEQKNAWENIIKFGMIILLVLGMVAISYITVNGYVKIGSMLSSSTEKTIQIQKNISMDIRKMQDILLASQVTKPQTRPVGMVNNT
jgi:hypothetical protein